MAHFTFAKVVLGWLPRKPATKLYPVQAYAPFAATRGHVEISIATCTFCSLCSKKCPCDAINVDRNTKQWSIDHFRCIQCNACVEACPKKCLTMNTQYNGPLAKKTVVAFSQNAAS